MPVSAIAESFRTTSTGFSTSSASGRRDFVDSDVQGLRIDTRRETDSIGEPRIVQSLQLLVHRNESSEWITIEQEIGQYDSDQIFTLCDRIVDNLADRVWDRLRRGEEIHGEGWTLSLIFFQDHVSGQSCFTEQLGRVRWVDDELFVFHEDNSHVPIGRYSRSAENAALLYQVLSQLIIDSPAPEPTHSGLGLGKRLNTIDSHRARVTPRNPATLIVGSLLATMLGGITLYSLSVGIVLIVMTLAIGIPLLQGRRESLTQFERALVWSCGAEETVILTDQLARMTVAWPDDKHEADGRLPIARFQFETGSDQSDAIVFEISLNHDNRGVVESLKSQTTAVVATHMNQRLDQHGCVGWTNDLILHTDRLEGRLENGTAPLVLHFNQIESWDLTAGRLTLRQKNGESPWVVSTDEANFYPGFLVLQMKGVLVSADQG